jgi:hypothetical protein
MQWGFTANFALSSAGRALAILIFVFFVHQAKPRRLAEEVAIA